MFLVHFYIKVILQLFYLKLNFLNFFLYILNRLPVLSGICYKPQVFVVLSRFSILSQVLVCDIRTFEKLAGKMSRFCFKNCINIQWLTKKKHTTNSSECRHFFLYLIRFQLKHQFMRKRDEVSAAECESSFVSFNFILVEFTRTYRR